MNLDNPSDLIPERISKNIDYFAGRTWLLPTLIQWFEKSDDRFFILQGAPGTGKSMIMAWLAGVGPPPSNDEQARLTLEKINSLVKAVHFCTANTGSVDPKAMVKSLAKQLTAQVAGFRNALVASLSDRVQIIANITESKANSITGIIIKELNLGGLDDDSSFNLAIREPLKKLYELGYNESMIILVDALDESLTYAGQKKIVEILAGLSDIPKKVRFIVTTRPDPAVLRHFQNIKPFDLVKDAPDTIDDIHLYVLERMQQIIATNPNNAKKIDSFSVGKLAHRISEAAKGIFLYAHLLFSSILPKLPDIPTFIESGLPDGLGDLYDTFLNREIGSNDERWYNNFKPLLGLISVSQGKGLTKNQLNSIIGHNIGHDIEHSLLIWKEYLEGHFPEGPFHVFHKSFSDFLLEDKKDNINRRINALEMHKKIIDHYWPAVEGLPRTNRNRKSMHEEWKRIAETDGTDTGNRYFYALYHLADHLDFVLEHDPTDNISLDRLYQLARNEENFAKAQVEYLSDIDLPAKTIRFALSAAARIDDAPSIAEFMIAYARRMDDTRKKESPLLMLRSGQGLEHVWNACDLYDIEISSLWHLLIASELYDTGTRLLDAKNTLKRLSRKRHIPGETDRFSTLMTLLLICAYNIDKDLFEELYPKLPYHHDVEPLLKEVLKALDFETAEKICVKMADSPADSLKPVYGANFIEFVKVAKAQAQAGHIEEAKKTANKIGSRRDIGRNLSKFSEKAIAQAQAGHIEEAKKTANRIYGFDDAKLSAFSEIAIAQAQAGDNSGSRATFEEAKKTANRIYGYYANAKLSAFSKIAKAQAQAGHIEEAKKTAKEIRDYMYKSSAFSEIAIAQAQAGHIEEAKKMAKEIRDYMYKSFAFSEIAKAQAQAGHIEEAKKTAKEIDDYYANAKLSAFSEIAIAQAQAGDNSGSRATFEEAKKTAKEIRDYMYKSSAFSKIAIAQAQAGHIEEAKKMAKEIRDDREKLSAFSEIAIAQAQAGDNSGSRATASNIILDLEIEKKIDEPLLLSFLEVAKAQAQAGDNSGSRATFEEAKKMAKEIDGYEYKSSALSEIAKAQAQAGHIEEAKKTAKEIDDYAYAKSSAFLEVAKAQAQAGHIEEAKKTAKKTADKMNEHGRDPSSAFSEIAKAQAQAGHIEEAKKTANKIHGYEYKLSAFSEIAKAQAQAGDNSGSRATFEEAKKMANKKHGYGYIHGYRYKSSAFSEIAIAQAQAGDNSGSRATFEEAKKMAKEMHYEFDKSFAFSEIAKAQAQAGHIEEAKKTAKNGYEYKSSAFSKIAIAQAQAGHIEEAKKTAKEIDDYDYKREKSSAFSEIAKAQAQMKMFSSALETSKEILADREYHLTLIADEIINAGGKEDFKQILIPSSRDLVTAIQIVSTLFKAYPEQSNDISKRLSHIMNTVL